MAVIGLRLRSGFLERVDPDTAGLQAKSNTLGSLLILAPDASTKTRVGIVGTVDDLFFVRVGLDRQDQAELLLLDNLAVVRRVVDNGRLDPEAIFLFNLAATGNEVVALGLAVLEEGLDLLILHLVLDGAQHGTVLVGGADLKAGGNLGHCVDHGSVDLLVDVNTLSSNANLGSESASKRLIRTGPTYLTTVLEGTHNKLWSSSLNIDIFSDDTGVVAAELESNTLESLAASSHNLLSGGGAACETDLCNTRVLGEHGTKLVITTKDLNDTRWEDGLSQLNGLQRCVGSERRGFDDDGATSKESRTDLAERENQRELSTSCQY